MIRRPYTASWLQVLIAKLFWKKFQHTDSGWTVTIYENPKTGRAIMTDCRPAPEGQERTA